MRIKNYTANPLVFKLLFLIMPKTSYARATRKYVPKRGRPSGATTKKPYGGSRYGNDAYVKVEAIENLSNTGN